MNDEHEKYYSWKNKYVFDDRGGVCEIYKRPCGDEIRSSLHDMYLPGKCLRIDFISGNIHDFETEVYVGGRMGDMKPLGVIGNITEFNEITEKQAMEILSQRPKTISEYLENLQKENNNE